MNRILILTHSDPTTDSRILKTHEVANSGGRRAVSIGVEDPESPLSRSSRSSIILVNFSRRLRDKVLRKPKPGSFQSKVFFLLIYTELTVKMTLRSILFRPQVVHCNDWFVLPIAVLVKVLTGSKLIYDAHELESQTNNPNLPSEFILRVEQTYWGFVDFFTTVSPSINSWYQRELGPKPFEVILNSPVLPKRLDISQSSVGEWDLRLKFGISSSSVIYLYIGMLEAGRGIDTILEAFMQTTTDSVVVFLGFGSYRKRIEQQGERRRNVFVHNRVPHNQVVGLAQSADFGLCLIENVSLSDYFCIPNKLIECAFSGIPVVASKLPEIQRVVEDYKLGMCFENTTARLIEVLEKNSSGAYVKRSADVDLEPLSWEAQAVKLETVFRTVGNQRRGKQ